MDLTQLNNTYAIAGHISFKEGNGGFIEAHIDNKFTKSSISLYGAHIQSFQPKGEKEVLWMSPKSTFEAGKPIRGGIPVCFPWFGPHATDSQKPAHGFARLNNWEVVKTAALSSGGTELILGFKNTTGTLTLWPYQFSAEMRIVADSKLDVTLSYTNTGKETFTCTDALHSYFSISAPENISIYGLKGATYYVGFAKEANNKQDELLLKIKQEENRRYLNHTDDCIINDIIGGRKIRVAKRNSKETVVWNPWEVTVKTMGDIPEDGYLSFVCIEAANIYDSAVVLKPGESFSISTIINIEQ